MEKIKFEYSFNNQVANIILDDGKGNILDSIMMRELHEIFEELSKNKKIKLITFEGAGKHFSFGASVAEHRKEFAKVMLEGFCGLFYELIEMGIPILSKISGQCLGGGMELALMSNFIFADKSAKFGQPEIVLGVFAPPASIILPLKIGNSKAEQLLISGNIISAEEAEKTGLIHEIYEDKEELNKASNAWIEKNILPKSASSLRYAVKAARIEFNEKIKNYLPKLENIFLKELMETFDANEGIEAFMEKRTPIWE